MEETVKKNYMAEISKNRNLKESFENFFNCSVTAESEINDLTSLIKKKQKEIEEVEQKLSNSYAKKYREKYTQQGSQ